MNILQLIAAIVITEGAGALGSIFTAENIPGWYKTLKRPALNPPNWIFAPVWTTLYLLMAIALTIFEFAKISPSAAWLMVPYIAWVTFAAYLNFGIWRLN